MKRDFLRLLKELDEDELREELKTLYERFPALREYYKLELSGSTKAVLDKYKKDVRKAFFTGRRRMGKRGRSNSAKVIKDFREVSIHAKDLIELNFYRVAVMVEAMEFYNVESEPFYNSMLKSFERSAEMAKKELMLDTFRETADEIVSNFEAYDRYGEGRDLRQRFQTYWG
ncbi:hypothetical protein FUA23_11625 [Neolewinella aurantiaca]|uniref:Uncharacterized protein n=1 Tax=Neolewinella aurantiaca TaxID=2602767 RepID=A0A5C7FRZ1_9BACT|nr:DUF6155 family protein [Neolewinella aurantiaca]TXF89153.1 hypothetical protein FUA23_11625 [Neolewinella aurantiaca]